MAGSARGRVFEVEAKQKINTMAKEINETEEQKKQRENIETIAKNISSLAKSVHALLNGQLNRKALLTLLASSSGQSKSVVSDVLDSLENLEKEWINK